MGEENRVWVKSDQIPQYLKDAAVAIEDKRFYKHNGVDWIRTVKAISLMFTGQDIQGGSTPDPAAHQKHDQRQRGHGKAENHGDFPGPGI